MDEQWVTSEPGSTPAPEADPGRRRAVRVGTVPGGVLAVLVSHDGERWLPTVLEGLAAQEVAPDHVVAVDTGSRDASRDLLETALGPQAVVVEPLTTAFPQAVRRALAHAPDTAWVWLLHDDSTPHPGALAALLEAAAADPDVDVLGPKLREWPSLRRLLEVGLTISGTGRRETGLEPGEYDQGQHDEIRPVLAVNTAGMLVRRSVLDELGGFDDRLPVFGNDLDFGWRAARAGRRTVVVPQAVVFHAEAAHRGLRRTPLTGSRTHLAERSAALHTVLANTTGALLPVQLARLLVGSLLRVLGYLVVRSPGEAVDELAAVMSVYLRPGELRAARRERAALGPTDDRVRRLLAPAWVPYRHGLDAVGDLAAAATHEATDVSERRRAARESDAVARGDAPRRPVGEAGERDGDDDEVPYADSGLLVRFLTDPVALVLTVAVLALLWATHQALAGGALSGAGLSPAPPHASDWWRLHVEAHHPLGQGSDVAAPAYVLPMALLATLLLGHPGAAVGLVLLAAGPLAVWGAWRLLRLVGRLVAPRVGAPISRWVLVWGSVTYGLTPLVSGAWGQGRLGPVVGAAVLPWLAHAALGFADPVADRRRRAAWRCALLLALVTAFAPVAWAYAALLTALALLALLVGGVARRGLPRDRSVWLPLLIPVLATPVLLLPWTLPTLLDGRAPTLLLEAGRLPSSLVDGSGAAAGRLVDGGAPPWSGLLLAALALAALLLPRARAAVLLAWGAAGVAAVLLAVLDGVPVDLPVGQARPGVGLLVVVLAGCAVVATAVGLQQLSRLRWAAVLGLLAATVVPVAGLVWALTDADQPLEQDADTDIPAYLSQNAAVAPDRGLLIVAGSVDDGLDYRVQRGEQVTTGQDEVLAATPDDPALTRTVAALVTRPDGEVVDRLAALGVAYVVLPAPADGRVAARLDATDGLEAASAEDPQTRVWRLTTAPSAEGLAEHDGLTGQTSAVRWLLVVVQGGLVLLVLVLCGPARRDR